MLVVAALVAAVIGFSTGRATSGDPVREWASSVGEVCVVAAGELVELGAPASFVKEDQIRPWAGSVAEVFDGLAGDVSALGGDDRGARVVAGFEARARVYREIARADSELPDLSDGDQYSRALARADTDIRAVLEPFGVTSCSQLSQPAAVAPQQDAYVRWLTELEASCQRSVDTLTTLDDELGAGSINRAMFVERAGGVVEELSGALERLRPPENLASGQVVAGRWSQLVDDVQQVAAALRSGDVDTAAENGRRWASTGESMGLGACARGLPAGRSTPSGLVGAPTVPGYAGGGSSREGGVTDSESVLRFLVDAALPAAGSDPERVFNLPAVLDELLGGSATSGPGDIEASSGTVSLSGATSATAYGTGSKENPWVVGIAVADSSGRCTFGAFYGYPRLVGSTWAPGDGPCTGERARSIYQVEESS
jgi:hypothetical protein